MSRDVTFKGRPRVKREEIAVFEVHDGKIISEQFFYYQIELYDKQKIPVLAGSRHRGFGEDALKLK